MRNVGEGETAGERRLTAAAVSRPLALLRHVLRLAHEEWEAIDDVPRIRLEKEPQGRLRWLIQEEITRELPHAQAHVRVLAVMRGVSPKELQELL